METNDGLNKCQCLEGFYFEIDEKTKKYGCKRNCSMIENSLDGVEENYFGTCICEEHYFWAGQSCIVDCSMAS